MEECKDERCPIHGRIKIRGNIFTGRVISDRPDKTVIIERILTLYKPKYERYRKVRSKIAAHNPRCINAKEKDLVKVGETRKLSKTKSFVVLEKIEAGKE